MTFLYIFSRRKKTSSSCAECARGTVPILLAPNVFGPLAPVESTAHDITALNTPVDFPPLRRHPETERAVWGGDIADLVGFSQWCVSRKSRGKANFLILSDSLYFGCAWENRRVIFVFEKLGSRKREAWKENFLCQGEEIEVCCERVRIKAKVRDVSLGTSERCEGG